MPRLTEQEKADVLRYLDADKPLPDRYRFLLFDDKRAVELVWNGKTSEVCNVVLPFQTIESIDEPRIEGKSSVDDELAGGLFDARGRQMTGWTNKLIWGDTASLQQQAGDARQVAQNIRPHIERYLRTCCPDALKAGEMFGSFKTKALEAINQGSLIISETKLAEVGEIVDYANKFHHDTNPDADNEIPQDAELLVFVRRTLTFASIG